LYIKTKLKKKWNGKPEQVLKVRKDVCGHM